MIKEENINCTVEALILASPEPVPVKRLAEAMGDITPARVREAVADLNNVYMGCGNSFRIREVAGGYQMYVLPDFEQAIKRLLTRERTVRLTRAALETLAIVAYKQPVTKIDIEHIRGVASDGVIHNLLQRKLILIAGRAETPGRPLLYKTSSEFLKFFGLNRLADLPRMDEIEEMIRQAEGPREQTVLPFGDSGDNGHRERSLLLLESLPGESIVLSAENIIDLTSSDTRYESEAVDDFDDADGFIDEETADNYAAPAEDTPGESESDDRAGDESPADDEDSESQDDGVAIPAVTFRRSTPDDVFEDADREDGTDETSDEAEGETAYEPIPDIPEPVQFVTHAESDDDDDDTWSDSTASSDPDEQS